MKTLSTFLNESLNDNIFKNIVSCTFNFGSTKSMPIKTKQERCAKGKVQEKIVIDVLSEKFPDYQFISCEEWCKQNHLTYSPKMDSYYGDFMICKDNKTLYNVDLKVGTKSYLGTPDALSLTNFGNNSAKEGGKYFYLCVNENGTDVAIISAKKLYRIQQTGKFIVSVNRTRELKNSAFNNAKIVNNKASENADLSKLYEEDFVSTSTIESNKDF